MSAVVDIQMEEPRHIERIAATLFGVPLSFDFDSVPGLYHDVDEDTKLLSLLLQRKRFACTGSEEESQVSKSDQQRRDVKILKRIVEEIQKYPEFFIHFMEQSNETNRNWDIITELIQDLSTCHINQDNHGTDSDCGTSSGDQHNLLTTFTAGTILNKERGWTLLHWLCSHGGSPIQVMQTLLHQLAAATTATCISEIILQPDSYIGDTCLHLLCRNACQFSATKLQLLLSSLSVQDAKSAVLIRNRLGGTMLHAATIGAAVIDVIRTIVSINPFVLQISSKDGVYPVTALWYSYSDTIPGYMSIVRLLEMDHNELPGNDKCLAKNKASSNTVLQKTNSAFQRFWDKVEYLTIRHFLQLTDRCPNHLLRVDNEHDTDENKDFDEQRKYILHGLLQCNVPINMIKLCLRIYPICATAIDCHGNTPLHILVQNRPYHNYGTVKKQEYEAIQVCVDAYPAAAGWLNHNQQIPLQLAIMNKIPISSGIYDILLHAAPSTIQFRCRTKATLPPSTHENDDAIGFYPYQLAATQNNTSLQSINTIYYLILKQPSLLCIRK